MAYYIFELKNNDWKQYRLFEVIANSKKDAISHVLRRNSDCKIVRIFKEAL